MRIAFLVTSFPNLSQTFISNQITGLIDRGYEIDVYARWLGEMSKVHPDVRTYRLCERTHFYRVPDNYLFRLFKGLKLIGANLWRAPGILLRSLNFYKYGLHAASLQLLYGAIACLNQEPYDVIHCHFGPNGLMGAKLRDIGALDGKLVTTFYGYDLSRYQYRSKRHYYRFLFREGDLFLAISETMRHRLVELDCDEKKILEHQLGVDLDRFSPSSQQWSNNGPVRIATIARLVPKKGIEYGIRAIAQLLTDGYNVTYTIVGDGPLRYGMQQLIQELEVSNAVKLIGWQEQQAIIGILNSSDILLAPSVTGADGDEEGTPVVLMEALALELPVVSTRHSGIPEVVADSISGCLVPERDVEAMAKALAYLIEHPEVRSKMGRAGRATIEATYSVDRLNGRLVEIYRRLLMTS